MQSDLRSDGTMIQSVPLVTIMIATKDRGVDLHRTLQEMRRQDYPATELIVIDDGSKEPIASVVQQIWPGATVIRHERGGGQCVRRNEGFALASGEYILQLDDDCSFVDPGDLTRAVADMKSTPDAGAVSFYVLNSVSPEERIGTQRPKAGCVASFMGAAVLMRKAALSQTSGYRTFFVGQWEEEELGLQLLRSGWKIVFDPAIVAHHRMSTRNRDTTRTWSRGISNSIWSMMIHMPAPRVFFEIGWKVSLGTWDAIRLFRPRAFFQAIFRTAAGLRRASRLRQVLPPVALQRYDALRLNPVLTHEEFACPPRVTWGTVSGFLRRWRNRARNRNVWATAKGDTGSSYTVGFAHELPKKSASLPGEK